MLSFFNKSFGAVNYAKFRPTYPKRLLEYVIQYHQENGGSKPKLTVDLACGTGQATSMLAGFSDKVVGLDFSESMIEQARQKSQTVNVEFDVGNELSLTKRFSPSSVDLLTVAEGAHRLKYPDFWIQSAEILRPGGTLALFAYWTFSLPEYPEVAEIIEQYAYGDDQCGPYWNKGREILDNRYQALADTIPESFTNVEYHVNLYDRLRPNDPFELVRDGVPLDAVIGMLKTWSAYFNFKEANPDKPDIADEVMEKINVVTNLTREDKVLIKWNTVYILGTKK